MEATIRTAVGQAVEELGIDQPDFAVEHPAESAHGDYACNVALVVAKQLGKSPRMVAEELQAKLAATIDNVAAIEVAGPGFLNFYLTRDFFSEKITRALAAGDAWGCNDSWQNKKVIVEYTDPNPFKEFHIGHLFTNSVGESIARLFMMNGAETKRVNYQGDIGMHVAFAVWGLIQHYGDNQENPHAKNGYFYAPTQLGMAYAYGASQYKIGAESVVQEIKAINKAIYEKTDEKINEIYKNGRSSSLRYFEEIYEKIGTTFDEYFFESEAGPRGKTIVLDHPDIFTDSDGAKVFLGEDYGLHTRVFINSEGLPTYEAKELALAKLKEERLGEYDHSVISTANEINEYFKVLLKAMSFVYPELAQKTEHIGHGTVRLSSGKMSSRTGDVISAVSFIVDIRAAALEKMIGTKTEGDEVIAEQVAIGAIKYATLKGYILQDSVFDKEKALSFEGDSGPYLQYTHARICSVLEKASAAGVTASIETAPTQAYEIEKLVYQFPEVIDAALAARAPHHVVTYLTQLAGAFNSFYAQEKIADPTDEFAPYKAAVADAVRQTLKNGLWVLGMSAPERM